MSDAIWILLLVLLAFVGLFAFAAFEQLLGWAIDRVADAEKKPRYRGLIRAFAVVGMIAAGAVLVTAVIRNGDEILEGLREFWP